VSSSHAQTSAAAASAASVSEGGFLLPPDWPEPDIYDFLIGSDEQAPTVHRPARRGTR